ncbi:MAG: hypothetical protein LPH21_03275 [Shewanella sp.]|nr:hypothetical protein [Shewanella sp.]
MPTPTYNALQHLIIAERVCNYVGQKMTKGAANKPIDMAHSWMRYQSQKRDFNVSYNKLPFYRKPMAWLWSPKPDLNESMLWAQRNEYGRGGCRSRDPFNWIIACALLTEQSGIGNCVEQAAVGFRYLCNYTRCEVFTLVDVGLDHAFLVIGAGNYVEGYYRLNKAPDWPANAVICDPWYNEWFIVKKDWCLKMRLILEAAEQEQPANLTSLAIGVIPIRCFVQGPGPV